MEQFYFKELPTFKTPEEELSYLREHVARREAELGGERHKEDIAKETLSAYSILNTKDVLNKEAQLTPKAEEAITLRLRPEDHDNTMEELLGILLSKGIKNTLDVLGKMNDAHLADDFHRFLVQYITAVGDVPGLKNEKVLWKALNRKLYAISVPEKKEEDKQSAAKKMEQLLYGIQAIANDKENSENNYITIEFALENKKQSVVMYVSLPNEFEQLFEKLLHSFFEGAEMREVSDDYNIFTQGGFSAGAELVLKNDDILPIKTYQNLPEDPMNLLIGSFSRLKENGEGASIQFLIAPAGDKFIKRYASILESVKKGMDLKRAQEEWSHTTNRLSSIAKELIFGISVEKPEEAKPNELVLQQITEKMKTTIMSAQIRIVAGAETKERANTIVRELGSVFHQFDQAGSNGFEAKEVEEKKMKTFLENFSYRLLKEQETIPCNVLELATICHIPSGITSSVELKQASAQTAPAPVEMVEQGVLLGVNEYRGVTKNVYMGRDDRMRHMYVVGQTGTGKTVFLKNMIIQDIKNGNGVCFIDPHGTDIQDILANIPAERINDVIYFDPAYTERPMGLNMLEYDIRYPEQKTFVVNELLSIFNKLFDMKVAGGPAFEQYFRNSTLLVMEDPESGMTLLEIGRVLADKEFRDLKLSRCKNPIIKQFWENAEKTTGEQSLQNFVPYITNKFDVFISNDIMRPVIAQEKSVLNMRQIMDEKKILLVNLSKGRLGDINASLIGLILVGKISMAALSRVDIVGKEPVNDFFLYIDEFQNVTTDSIAVILSEARKYSLSLTVAHQYIEQLQENIRNAVFGNIGTMVVHRVSSENAEVFEKQFAPTFTKDDIIKLENLHCYIKMLVGGVPVKPFSSHTPFPSRGNSILADKMKELSYLTYGRPREEVENEIMERYKKVAK